MLPAPESVDPYEFAACGLLTLSADGAIERVNATFCQWLGWDPAELTAKQRFQDLLTVGSKLFHQTHWFPLLQLQGSVAEVQIELVHRDGRTLAALVNAVKHLPPNAQERKDGRVHVAVFIATDRRKYERELLLARRRAEELLISEREAQKARSLAEDRLRLALDSASLYTWQVDLPSGAVSYERQAGALLGNPDAEHVSAAEYASAINPADRDRERAAFADAIDSRKRAPYSTEYRLIGVDGSERMVHATGRAFFDETGAAVGFTGVLEDVTIQRQAEDALREREAEFRMLAENSPNIIARFDRAHRFLYLNRSVQRLAGATATTFIGSRVDENHLFRDTTGSWSAVLESAFNGQEGLLSFFAEGSDGTRHEFEMHVVPERNPRGDVLTVLGITSDVTALKAQEREAAQRAVLAEQLVGIVSHDLRNPLNAVLLGTHLLRSGELSPSNARVAARIASSAERANRLVADLLDFTQARLGGGLRVVTRPMDLHSLVAECVEEVRVSWPGRMIDVRTSGPGTGRADPDRLAQLVSNLATNALTYGSADQPVIITSSVHDESLEIQVSNHGRPIEAELLAHIFEPLRRGEHSVKLGSRSIGLGLYIVREIASAHGGRVTVTSSEAEGTKFVVQLPRAELEG